MLGLGNILTKGGALLGFPNKYSFNFDGSNDCLKIEDNSGLDFTDGQAFSASIWFKTSISSEMYLFDNRSGNVGFAALLNASGDNYLGYAIDGSNQVTFTNQVDYNDGNWHHFAFTWNGTETLTSYIDGVAVGTGTQASLGAINGGDLFIGKPTASNTKYWNGQLDEFAIWSVALSADDVAKIASKPLNLSKASTYATDRTANLKLWLRAGDKVLPEEDKSIARSDFYTAFDGSDDYIKVDANSSINSLFATGGTFSAWVNLSSAGETAGRIAEKGFIIYTDDTSGSTCKLNIYIPFSTTDGNWKTTNHEINFGEWQHIAITYDGSSASNEAIMYFNGSSVAVTNNTPPVGTISADTADLYIGNRSATDRSFDGSMSSFTLHQTILDAQTISQMGKSRFIPVRNSRFSVVDFDGTNDKITFTRQVFTGAFTISWWFNGDTETFYQRMFDDSVGNNNILIKDSNGYVVIRINTHYKAIISGVPHNEWCHLAFTRDGSGNIKSYLNGVASGTSSSTDEFALDFIGEQCVMSMASASMYNVEKSADEIYAIYQQGITYDESSLSGLVGYWRMGDDTSKAYPTIADSSSNSNDGTITNGASDDIVQQMISGYDMGAFESTDLSDTYPAIIDVNEPVLGADIASSLTWVNSSSSPYETFVTSGNSITNAVNTSSFGIAYTSDFSLTSAKLYKISFDMDISSGSIDHVRIARATGMDTPTGLDEVPVNGTNTFYFIGASSDSDFKFGFRGNDAVAFSLSNLSLKEIQGNVGTMTQMDGVSNLVYSSVLPDQSFLTGVNSAYNFIDLDGSDQYIDAGALDSALEPPLSISMWVKGNAQTSSTLIQDDSIHSGLLYLRGGSEIAFYSASGEKSYSYTLNNTWVNIVMTQASSAKPLVYVNGSLLSNGTQDNTPNPSFSNIRIGGDNVEFNGSIGQTAIWNKELSSTEVGAIYTLGRHGNLLDSYSDNLKGYWAMSALDASTGLSDSISTIYDRSGNSNNSSPQNADAGDLASSPNAEPNGYAKQDSNRTTTTP